MLLGFGPLTYGSFVHDTAHLHTTGVSDILSTDSCITAPAMLHKHYKRPGYRYATGIKRVRALVSGLNMP
jgi:hypothetical protein